MMTKYQRRFALPLFIMIATAAHAAAVDAADATSARPNILLAIADDASYPYAGAYGCAWIETPSFDSVARRGLLFTRAYTPNAKCAPSRSSILTGRYSWQLEAAANHNCYFPAKFKAYTEVLAARGYHVGMTGKGWGPGVAKNDAGRSRRLAGEPYEERQRKAPAGGISSNDYAGNFEDFLADASDDQPWCFWYGAHEPHRGYEYGSGISRGGKQLHDIDEVPDFWPDNETVRTDLLDYAYELEHFDDHLGRMLRLLEERGQLKNTLVVVTADNGMPFPRVKGQCYDMDHRLPLAMMWPAGIEKPGRTIEEYVSFIDFAPTFMEVARIEWSESGMHATPGKSLTDVFKSESSGDVRPVRDHVLIGKERHDVGRPNDWGYPVRGIVKGNLFYVRNFEPARWPAGNPKTGYLNVDGSPTKTVILQGRTEPETERFWQWSFGKRPAEELYDVAQDPHCMSNLSDDPEYAAAKQTLEEQMLRELREQDDPRMFGRGEVFDQYPYAAASSRNFYERYQRGEKLSAGWVNPSDFEQAAIDTPKSRN
jgi:N-sulfoglucosamine sulfohydrolase